ncbi:hypothetical protein Pogu_0529 [Pyrobaculum oguniense TE7]|uniref:Uncharacterized protein n=1 Tax=Pyrobaculum oguniense (strain DSM 13380 / JCM 10595 / TE7) TaxID=698757 RepID=H6Q792_PYROT|nr:hypothetical protein Pogu_0529 [Pyrobaculum oguniense TE7]
MTYSLGFSNNTFMLPGQWYVFLVVATMLDPSNTFVGNIIDANLLNAHFIVCANTLNSRL